MKRLTTPTLTLALALAAGGALAEELTVVGFGGALQDTMRKTFFDTWEGGEITEESYTGGIAKIKAMVDTGTTTWDVVQMDENEMMLACDEGLLEIFDWAALPYADEIMPDAKSECGVGAFVWSMVPAYDAGAGKPVASWADFWDIEGHPGKRGLRKQARMTLEIALLADGVAPGQVYAVLATKEGQDRAFAKLDEIKDDILWWESGAQPIEWLASGDLAMTAAYNGRVVAARKEGRDFDMAWDGQLYAMDFWAIPQGGKTDAAFDLVAHMVAKEPQKAFAEDIVYGVSNLEATQLIDPAIASDLPTAPDNMAHALGLSTPFWVDYEEELQQRFNTWVAK